MCLFNLYTYNKIILYFCLYKKYRYYNYFCTHILDLFVLSVIFLKKKCDIFISKSYILWECSLKSQINCIMYVVHIGESLVKASIQKMYSSPDAIIKKIAGNYPCYLCYFYSGLFISNNISTCFCIIISAVLLALMSVDLLIPVSCSTSLYE